MLGTTIPKHSLLNLLSDSAIDIVIVFCIFSFLQFILVNKEARGKNKTSLSNQQHFKTNHQQKTLGQKKLWNTVQIIIRDGFPEQTDRSDPAAALKSKDIYLILQCQL